MSVLNEYEEVLIGNQDEISKEYFIFDRKGNERIALSVFRHALENLLGWDVNKAIDYFNENYIHVMKLEQMVKYIVFPSDVSQEDTEYILHLLYPRQVDYELKKYTLRVYDDVLAGKRRYPKDYMYGYLGLLRAKICLQHSIAKSKLFRTLDDLYSYFASPKSLKYLKENKLMQLYYSFYDTPLEYMHDCLPSSMRNEFLFHNYMFEIRYRNLTEGSGLNNTGNSEDA